MEPPRKCIVARPNQTSGWLPSIFPDLKVILKVIVLGFIGVETREPQPLKFPPNDNYICKNFLSGSITFTLLTGASSQNVSKLFSKLKLVTDNLLEKWYVVGGLFTANLLS